MQSTTRSLAEIAKDIRKDWKNVKYSAEPYLIAMQYLTNVTDKYGDDSAASIVGYFLCNAGGWRGEQARKIKAELNAMLKS
jgi:hypothetical protein